MRMKVEHTCRVNYKIGQKRMLLSTDFGWYDWNDKFLPENVAFNKRILMYGKEAPS